eukprot:365303-Chlamydomonas_euryale.AAC.6
MVWGYTLPPYLLAERIHHILNAARLTRLGHVAKMPDEPVVKQLLFAEGLIGPGWHGRQAMLHMAG